jgi:hypothetical protein
MNEGDKILVKKVNPHESSLLCYTQGPCILFSCIDQSWEYTKIENFDGMCAWFKRYQPYLELKCQTMWKEEYSTLLEGLPLPLQRPMFI